MWKDPAYVEKIKAVSREAIARNLSNPEFVKKALAGRKAAAMNRRKHWLDQFPPSYHSAFMKLCRWHGIGPAGQIMTERVRADYAKGTREVRALFAISNQPEKTWCAQCDRLVFIGEAIQCQSRFCKVAA